MEVSVGLELAALRNQGGHPVVMRTIEEYLTLPYTLEIQRDSTDGYTGYVARVLELPGCMTQADTFEELDEMLQDAMRTWIETALEDGQQIPEPRIVEEYSGKFVVRVPKSLHRQLAQSAEREGVSLNALINMVLGHYTGSLPREAQKTRKSPI
jgi:antitoxin HicB